MRGPDRRRASPRGVAHNTVNRTRQPGARQPDASADLYRIDVGLHPPTDAPRSTTARAALRLAAAETLALGVPMSGGATARTANTPRAANTLAELMPDIAAPGNAAPTPVPAPGNAALERRNSAGSRSNRTP